MTEDPLLGSLSGEMVRHDTDKALPARLARQYPSHDESRSSHRELRLEHVAEAQRQI